MRLELCPKPIQKPSQSPPNRDSFSPKVERVFPKTGTCFSQRRVGFLSFQGGRHGRAHNSSGVVCRLAPSPWASVSWQCGNLGLRVHQGERTFLHWQPRVLHEKEVYFPPTEYIEFFLALAAHNAMLQMSDEEKEVKSRKPSMIGLSWKGFCHMMCTLILYLLTHLLLLQDTPT